MNSVIKNISDSVLFSNSSEHIWKQLELRYGQVDRTKIFQIQRDLCSASQGSMSIVDYYTKLKLLWDDYSSLIIIPTCPCGEKCQTYDSVQNLIQDQQIMQLLVGLNEAFKVVRGNILMMRPFLDINEVYNTLLEEENQRGLHLSAQISQQSVALHVPTSKPPSIVQEPLGLVAQQRQPLIS